MVADLVWASLILRAIETLGGALVALVAVIFLLRYRP